MEFWKEYKGSELLIDGKAQEPNCQWSNHSSPSSMTLDTLITLYFTYLIGKGNKYYLPHTGSYRIKPEDIFKVPRTAPGT